MRALRGLPLEKEREALRPPTQRRVFPSSPPSAAANPAKEGHGEPKNRQIKENGGEGAILTEIGDQISWLALVTAAHGEAAQRCHSLTCFVVLPLF